MRLPASPTEIVGVEFRAMARRRRGVRPGSPVAGRHAGPRALPEERVIRADRDPQRQQCPAGSRSDTFGRTGIGNSLAGMMIVQATSTRPAYLGHAICICPLDRRTYRGDSALNGLLAQRSADSRQQLSEDSYDLAHLAMNEVPGHPDKY